MAPFDECSVLLPSATLDDFPAGGADADARSLLAGWTVLWHPLLLAETGQLPTWYRADAPPTPDGPRVIVVPDPSLKLITNEFRRKCDANPRCQWVTGGDRNEMMRALELDPEDPAMAVLEAAGRTIAIDDFFAAGYLSLQIQIMTRRLRYTSNLDELHLQNRIVAAAKAFRDRDAAAATEGLHDVFDALSEERDHYFSSDPHLIDLTLLTPQVLRSAIATGWIDRFRSSATAEDENHGVLGNAKNLLIDGEVAAAICTARDPDVEPSGRNDSEDFQRFGDLIQSETIGWAGGGSIASAPSDSGCLDAMTMATARHAFQTGTTLAMTALGVAPTVYGRLSGTTPADLVPALATLGYKGVIPIDFTAGSGFGDESKVLISGGGCELEALTAKPIDAASDASFLSLGARLGELIDTGEVATALLVHWPDRVCASFMDLSRAATWSAALGRFWTLDRYFTAGERPYHHGTLETLSSHAAAVVADQLTGTISNASLQSMAEEFAAQVTSETRRSAVALAKLARPRLLDPSANESADSTADQTRQLIAQAVGVAPASEHGPAANILCFNPQSSAVRLQTRLTAGAPADEKFVYAATSAVGGTCDVTFDVPALGFTRLSATHSIKKLGLLKRLTGGGKGIAEPGMLGNEFMSVTFDEATGAVSGVFSASRGNRLSMRLVAADDLAKDDQGGRMKCNRFEVNQSDRSIGIMTASGELLDANEEPIADFTLRYQLQRGSRLLQIEGSLKLKTDVVVDTSSQLWKKYIAIRTAVAGEAAMMRPLVRDKVHSSKTKRFVAPLGVIIDEAEKQTLLTGHGLPLYRKVGDRFLDLLVAIPGQPSDLAFHVTYAFDCPGPVAVARSCIAPAEVMAIQSNSVGDPQTPGKTEQAWLMHVAPHDVMVTEMTAQRRLDGKLTLRMQLIQTRPKTANVKLQFCVQASAAFIADQTGIERSLEQLPDQVQCADGVVTLAIGSHRAVDLVVVFDL